MIRRLPLGPGSGLPAWIEELEVQVFGQSWGALTEHELLWCAEDQAFARWSAVPAIAEAELLRIAVTPASRRRGLARDLMRACVGELAAQGIRTLRLEVRLSNTAAIALYEGEGWVRAGTRPRYYSDGEDAALYTRELPPAP